MKQVTTKSFTHIFATTRKAGLFLLILAIATGTASVQAKPPPDDPPPDEPGGITEVLAVLDAIQLKLEKLETDHQNIDTIIDAINGTTGMTKVAVDQVKLTTDVINGTTGMTKVAIEQVKSTTDAINSTTGMTKVAVFEVKSTTDVINSTTGLTKVAVDQVKSTTDLTKTTVDTVKLTTDLTKNTVDIVKILSDLNLDEDLFSIDVCFDVGLGLASNFGMDASLAFNAEGRVGAEAFGNGVIGKVYGDGGLTTSLKTDLGASAVGVACIDIKSLVGGLPGVLDDIRFQLEDLADQLNISPTTLSIAMAELPSAATSLLQSDISLLNLSSGSEGPFDVLLGALPLPPGIDVADLKDQTSFISGEFDFFVGSFSEKIETFCEQGFVELAGIPAQIIELYFVPVCAVVDPEKVLGAPLKIALTIINNILAIVDV